MKRILDSVHGYISVPKFYMDNIVDTPEFQRLRRIEQTSCRALFPSARHDRFIHSLGVFHLGTLMAENLWEKNKDIEEKRLAQIIITYRLACLLHDVGHTPFSHTFEEFFCNTENNLPQRLADLIPEDKNFLNDFKSQFTKNEKLAYAPHELMSAIVAITKFKTKITDAENNEWKEIRAAGDCALLARMIVGCKYQNGLEDCLQNAFIDLIHGDVIDADGLDYVCRDVWASGYSTSKVDVSRLIKAITIYTKDNTYRVCFDSKAINEIKSVLQVKAFQSDFVFNHHALVYEQEMLVQAMKTVALYYFGKNLTGNEEQKRDDALKKLCNFSMYLDGLEIPNWGTIRLPMDDDFIVLMKSIPPKYDEDNGSYIQQWLSRNYLFVPLWKSRTELLDDLGSIDCDNIDRFFWLYTDKCIKYLKDNFKLSSLDIMLIETSSKDRLQAINKAHIFVNNHEKPYTSMYPSQNTQSKLECFMYLYVVPGSQDLCKIKESLISECKDKYKK